MKPFHIILWALPIACMQAEEAPDLLRFTNTDRLQGKFLGITEGTNVQWQRNDSSKPLDFQTRNLRHIVLHSGKPKQALQSLSYVDLTNGDRIPGTISGLNEQTLTLDTEFAGTLSIPRNKIRVIAPSPMGDSVYYHGPFSTDDWFMKNPGSSNEMIEAGSPVTKSDKPTEKSEKSFDRWNLSGSAWYWNQKSSGTGLIRKACMPDTSMVRFEMVWKGRLNLAIGLHADFQPTTDQPNQKEAPQQQINIRVMPQQMNMINPSDPSLLPGIFGNAYVLQINSNYVMLTQCIVNQEGESSIKRIEGNTGRLRISENNRSTVEIRSDQKSGNITLFVDGEFITQWTIDPNTNPKDKAHPNKGMGFVSTINEAAVRISDIVISDWNGMPDSARSMQTDEQDVALMTNGLDRYSGKAIRLNDQGMLEFEGRYGKFEFPIRAITQLHIANNTTEPSVEPSKNEVTIRLDPIGSLTGTPHEGNNSSISLSNPIIGKINLSLDSAVMLDWNSGKQFDAWDEAF